EPVLSHANVLLYARDAREPQKQFLPSIYRTRGMTPAGAKFSRCRRWRYLLWRKWCEGPVANFLMLNPSTADEVKLDPSCTRARIYAEQWGFGALIVTNLFGWRATDPDNMKAARDPVGRGNDAAIVEAARHSKLVVCAWGNHGLHCERSTHVMKLLQKP